MEIPQTTAESTQTTESKNIEPACAGDFDEYRRSSESDCARAMAQAEKVLREISPTKPNARRPGRQLVSEKADNVSAIGGTKPRTHPHRAAVRSGVFDLRLAKAIPDRLFLDQGLDFVVHEDGAIEVTPTGFWRMSQAHSAGLDVVIGVDSRDLLRLPVPVGDVARNEKSQNT
jgi:hypothetical protein